MPERPHIIIFNPDEMRADTMGHLGNPAAHTPFFDRFAAEDAVSFRNAYCQNPVCVPSRCSFFTGLYPHVRGHRTMAHLLRPGESSLFQQLHEAGYHIWMNDRNDLYAAQYPGWAESHCDEMFSGGNGPLPPGAVHPNRRGEPGGKFYYSHFEGQLQTDSSGRHYNMDDEAVDAAIARIGQWKSGDAPLCIFLGLQYPHTPYRIEEPYFSSIDRTKLPPRVRWEDCKGKSQMLSLYRTYQNLQDFTEEEWDELRAVYLGMCSKVDAQFGRLCAALRKAGMYDESAVLVLSDHGDFAGDYGMAEKAQNCFEDCLTRVPLLIKPPKGIPVSPGISDSLVELVDFYATVIDFSKAEPAHTHFGKSLLPVLSDRSVQLRSYVFSEGGRLPGEEQCDEYHQAGGRVARTTDVYWPKKMAQLDDTAHAKATMVRGERYKYISRTMGQDELYDLLLDPGEKINRIEDASLDKELCALRGALLQWLQTTSDIVPFDYDSRMTRGRVWNIVRPLIPPECHEDVRQMVDSGASIEKIFGYCQTIRR